MSHPLRISKLLFHFDSIELGTFNEDHNPVEIDAEIRNLRFDDNKIKSWNEI